jgi:hypothetical protein
VLAAKSVLVSALTGRKLEIVDWPKEAFRIEKGDVLLLASDGLNTLPEAEIESIVTEVEPDGAVKLSRTLLETVKSRRADRQDNTTVAVARVLELPTQASAQVPATDLDTFAARQPRTVTPPPRSDVATTPPTEPAATARTVPAPPSTVGAATAPHPIEALPAPARAGRGPLFAVLSVVFALCALALVALGALYVVKRDLYDEISGWWRAGPAVTQPTSPAGRTTPAATPRDLPAQVSPPPAPHQAAPPVSPPQPLAPVPQPAPPSQAPKAAPPVGSEPPTVVPPRGATPVQPAPGPGSTVPPSSPATLPPGQGTPAQPEATPAPVQEGAAEPPLKELPRETRERPPATPKQQAPQALPKQPQTGQPPQR